MTETLEKQYDNDPINIEDALSRPDKDKWIDIIMDKYKSLMSNDIQEIVPRPLDRKVIDTRWTFHIKHNIDGSIEKRKGRFIAKGFTQIPGVDYMETYSLIVSHTSIRILIILVAQYDLHIHQMDVKSAYLNRKIDIDIYIEQPLFFEKKNKERYVYKLKKELYRLKQAGRI